MLLFLPRLGVLGGHEASGPGESYSDVILRLVEIEAKGRRQALSFRPGQRLNQPPSSPSLHLQPDARPSRFSSTPEVSSEDSMPTRFFRRLRACLRGRGYYSLELS
jgi:hypothetical protein